MKDKLTEQASPYFKAHPQKDEIFATSDGNFFWEENYARLHAVGTRNQAVLEVYRITRQELKKQADEQASKTTPQGDQAQAAPKKVTTKRKPRAKKTD